MHVFFLFVFLKYSYDTIIMILNHMNLHLKLRQYAGYAQKIMHQWRISFFFFFNVSEKNKIKIFHSGFAAHPGHQTLNNEAETLKVNSLKLKTGCFTPIHSSPTPPGINM